MKKLKVLIQVSMMIAMAAGIFRDDIIKVISFSLLFIFAMYIYPRIVIFIAKKFGARPSTTGYDGEITITKSNGDEPGSIVFKLYSEPDILSSKDEVCLLIKKRIKTPLIIGGDKLMKYIVKSFSPIYNYCIEEYSKNCGYCEILKREFVTHSSDKFCEWRLTITMSVFRKHGYKKDINDILKKYFNGKKCHKYWWICKAR